MKPIVEQTYYEILDLPPSATTEQVEAAFQRAMEFYGPGSLAIYTLVDEAEARLLVQRIEEAYLTLTDPALRREYDANLTDQVATLQASLPPPVRQPAPASGDAPQLPLGRILDSARVYPWPGSRPEIEQAHAVAAALESDGASAAARALASAVAAYAPPLPEPPPAPSAERAVVPSAPAATPAALASEPPAVTRPVEAPEAAPRAPELAPKSELPETPVPTAAAASLPAPAAVRPADEKARAATEEQVSAPAADPVAERAPAAKAPAVEKAPVPEKAPAIEKAPAAERSAAAEKAPPAEKPAEAETASGGEAASSKPEERPAAKAAAPKGPDIPPNADFNGELLRRLREAKGLSLRELADRTRISLYHLENLEADRYDALPVAVYLRGFLMLVARELKLDPLKVSKSYLELVARAKAAKG